MLMELTPDFLVESLIRTGRLTMNDRFMPTKLALFLETMKKQRRMIRRGRRQGVVGSIDTIAAATTSQLALSWDASITTGLPAALRTSGPNALTVTNLRQPVSYTLGTSGVGKINQVAQRTYTIGVNPTVVDVDMVTWAKNVVNDTSATFSAYKEIWIELLTAAQGGGTVASASSITMGNHATNPWDNVLSATGLYTLKSGGLWLMQDQTSAGIGVTAGDLLSTLNNDASNIASVRMTAFGFK